MQKNQKILEMQKNWADAFGVELSVFRSSFTVVPNSKIPDLEEVKREEEIFVFKYKESSTIVICPDIFFKEIIECNGIDDDLFKTLLAKEYNKDVKLIGPVLSLYLFNNKNLKSIDNNSRYLDGKDKQLFENLFNSCSKKDREEVFMDFDDSTHYFYGYFENGELVSVCNYILDYENDKIAHIGLITHPNYRGKGFGKKLINNLSNLLLDKGLIPQYRVEHSNYASLKIAESLGYEKLIESYSFRLK